MNSVKIEPKLGKFGDILFQGKPLKEILMDETGRQASEVLNDELATMGGILRGSPKSSVSKVFKVKYNEVPSKCKVWDTKEIMRRNIMENIPDLPLKGTLGENVVKAMQESEESFTLTSITQMLTNEFPETKWILANIGSRVSGVYKALGDENETGPALLKRKREGGGYVYTATKEFKELPRQVICRMVSDFSLQDRKEPKEKVEKKISSTSKLEYVELDTKFTPSILDDLKEQLLEVLYEIKPSAITVRIEFSDISKK